MSSIEDSVSESSYENKEKNEEENEEKSEEENESEDSKTESEVTEKMSNDEIKPMPLTQELAACCLSLLHRLGYGFSHAFIKFNCVNKKITDISILESFRFLRFVNLSHNYISDLTPLFAAEYLMYLKVDHNYITLPGTHKNLQYLQFMDLSYNKLRSTDYINHGRLKHLILNNNEIGTLCGIDAPPLNQFKLRALETLETHGFIKGLPKLKYLNLGGNLIDRWTEVKKLSFILPLRTLILSGNPITDRENYRPITLGMMNKLQRLDKEKTTPEEISDSQQFFQTLDERYIDEDVEEDNRDDKEIAEDVNVDDDKESAKMKKRKSTIRVENNDFRE
nr:hypothetical transcript [Hymenolepis microstoma]